MKVTYSGRADAVQVGKQTVERGEAVDVSADVAASLVASGDWSPTPKPVEGTTEPDKAKE